MSDEEFMNDVNLATVKNYVNMSYDHFKKCKSIRL